MKKIIDADAAKLAGLQIDILQKVRRGQITLDQLERFSNLSPTVREARFGNKKKPELLLDLVGTVITTATTEPFVAKKKFKLKKDGGICFSLGNNFAGWFLAGQGKTENPRGKGSLRYAKLLKSSRDFAIVAELGGEQQAETTLAEVLDLMFKQAKGETGILLTDGRANIFYVRDCAGVLRTVYVYWNDGGWRVRASGLGDPNAWDDGDQVFSRN